MRKNKAIAVAMATYYRMPPSQVQIAGWPGEKLDPHPGAPTPFAGGPDDPHPPILILTPRDQLHSIPTPGDLFLSISVKPKTDFPSMGPPPMPWH